MTLFAKRLLKRIATALAAVCLSFPFCAWAAFTVNGDGTVTDTETGLMWDRCALGLSGTTCATGAPGDYTWGLALAEVSARNAASHLGFNDWRLPSLKELESLVDITRAPIVIDTIDNTAFPNTPASGFWSSTTFSPVPASAWFVSFSDGGTGTSGKTNNRLVRLVRGGQSFDLLGQAPQTLTFGAVPTGVVVGGAPTVNATSATPNSGNAIVYSSMTPTVCTVNASTGAVSAIAVGTCTIAADQAGNASYTDAAQVTQSFNVGQAAQSITFGAQAGQTFVPGGTFSINPLATGGASGNPIVYSSTTLGVCTVSGTTVTMVAAGICTIAANQAGNANYAAATQVTQNVAIDVRAFELAQPVHALPVWALACLSLLLAGFGLRRRNQ
jgi:Protein of unknown function (DUF1566)